MSTKLHLKTSNQLNYEGQTLQAQCLVISSHCPTSLMGLLQLQYKHPAKQLLLQGQNVKYQEGEEDVVRLRRCWRAWVGGLCTQPWSEGIDRGCYLSSYRLGVKASTEGATSPATDRGGGLCRSGEGLVLLQGLRLDCCCPCGCSDLCRYRAYYVLQQLVSRWWSTALSTPTTLQAYRDGPALRREGSWALMVGGWRLESKKKKVHFLNSLVFEYSHYKQCFSHSQMPCFVSTIHNSSYKEEYKAGPS
jgi:hypothetical protein